MVPFPCKHNFADNQVFDQTNDVQQCVKLTVATQVEYFFIMASSLEDKSTWIYVHQSINSLCLHKLDRKTKSKDEIGVCATVNFPRQSSAQVWDSELQAIKPNEATLGESLQIAHNSLETHNG